MMRWKCKNNKVSIKACNFWTQSDIVVDAWNKIPTEVRKIYEEIKSNDF